MPVPSAYRWVAIGNLKIKNRRGVPQEEPVFSLDEVVSAARSRLGDATHVRSYGSEKRLMWVSEVQETDADYRLLLNVGDKNASDASYVNFQTQESRDIKKDDDEGGHCNAHVLISKTQDALGGHRIVFEKVPGIYLTSIKDHFTWLCRDEKFKKGYEDTRGQRKETIPLFEFEGYCSSTLGDAIASGSLKDIELVRRKLNFDDGLDEDPLVEESEYKATLRVDKKPDRDQAKAFLSKVAGIFKEKFRNEDSTARMFVRIKAPSGQIMTSEVDPDSSEILEQALVLNEVVRDFNAPLPQRHASITDEMIDKMSPFLTRGYN